MEFGLLMPHFGAVVDPQRVLDGAKRAERLGFDSLWVRDHLFIRRGARPEDSQFLEGLTVLAAVGAVTSRIRLGTAALVPLRHPLHTAAIAATITQLVGPRLVFGIGAGSTDEEFSAVGLRDVPRLDLLMANVEIMRRAWSGEMFSWSDDFFEFDDVAILPVPKGGAIPLWYCGNTPKSARLAADMLEGWLPGRISFETLKVRAAAIREAAMTADRPIPVIGVMPALSIARKSEDALRDVDITPLLKMANAARWWVKPDSGQFSTVSDLEGLLLWGSPAEVVDQCRRLAAVGVRHIVFDCRLTFSRWEEQMELLAEEVLPALSHRKSPEAVPSRARIEGSHGEAAQENRMRGEA